MIQPIRDCRCQLLALEIAIGTKVGPLPRQWIKQAMDDLDEIEREAERMQARIDRLERKAVTKWN
jgi:ubiquinone biosynthesis protein UbiJ